MNSAFHDKGGIGRKLKNKRKNQSQAMINTVLVTKVTLRNYYSLERRDYDRTTTKKKANSGVELNFCRGFVLRKGNFRLSPTAVT